jgi:hypothetical protein
MSAGCAICAPPILAALANAVAATPLLRQCRGGRLFDTGSASRNTAARGVALLLPQGNSTNPAGAQRALKLDWLARAFTRLRTTRRWLRQTPRAGARADALRPDEPLPRPVLGLLARSHQAHAREAGRGCRKEESHLPHRDGGLKLPVSSVYRRG